MDKTSLLYKLEPDAPDVVDQIKQWGYTDLALAEPRPPNDCTGYVNEIPPNMNIWDKQGAIWGRRGHYPLFVMLGYGRQHSKEGVAARYVASERKRWWRALEPSRLRGWPWWWYHDSERFYWLEGQPSSGRGFSGCQ